MTGGLQNFVLGPEDQPHRLNRQAVGEQARISTSRKATHQAALASTAPAPGYASNSAGGRNTYPNPQYQQQPFDETVSSDFDLTKSSVQLDQFQQHPAVPERRYKEEQYSDIEEDDEARPAEAEYARQQRDHPQYKHGRQPHMAFKGGKPHQIHNGHATPGIYGRFEQAAQHGNMELRPSRSDDQPQMSSKKRGRSDQYEYTLTAEQQHEAQDLEPVDEDDHSLQAIPNIRQEENSQEFEGSSYNSQNGSQNGEVKLPVSSAASPDYTDEQLKAMAYQQLKDETWDNEPHGRLNDQEEQETQIPRLPLQERIQQAIDKDFEHGGSREGGVARAQEDLYSQLSKTEWDEAGDILISRITEVMQKYQKARQDKREMVSRFEKIIEDREKAIRGKSEILNKKFQAMKKGGEGVLGAKF